MPNSIIKICPSCGNDMFISELSCKNCGVKISGNFDMRGLSELSNADWEFVKQFLSVEGNISKMQEEYNETYNSIKIKLKKINTILGDKTMVDAKSIDFSTNVNDSKVIRQLQNRIIECGGESLMPVLKGSPVPFHLSSGKDGVESDGLRGVVLKWEIFDAIVKKAISLGGKMYRGDSAAQNGARIGSDELPLDTIDGFISTEFYVAKVGDTTLRRSTYYSGILAWANIVTNHRSQGKGGFITVNPEFMSEDNE